MSVHNVLCTVSFYSVKSIALPKQTPYLFFGEGAAHHPNSCYTCFCESSRACLSPASEESVGVFIHVSTLNKKTIKNCLTVHDEG